ncbi:MAG: H-NS histone family protein [Chlorobi bacterium]|nr:H-NS histone family protein [Chlorobiota bacterium]
MATISDLQAQIDALQKQLAEKQAEGKRQAIAEILEKMSEFGITIENLQRKTVPGKVKAVKAVKYRMEDKTWSGRGPKPKWVKEIEERRGKLSDYLVA